MKALILRHVQIEHAGVFNDTLSSKGIDIKYIDQAESLPQEDFDMLFVLGGYMGVYESNQYPFLNREFKIIEHFLKAQKPVIGICLGAQMLAHVLGEKVYKGQNGKEIGWYQIKKENNHKFFNGFPDKLMVFQWHQDTFDLPKNALRIYSSEKYQNQAFVYENAVGIQFHIELTKDMIKEWVEAYEEDLKQENIDKNSLIKEDFIKTTNELSYKLIENILQ
jgi:GMP synthase-like glutamine amidotransferase